MNNVEPTDGGTASKNGPIMDLARELLRLATKELISETPRCIVLDSETQSQYDSSVMPDTRVTTLSDGRIETNDKLNPGNPSSDYGRITHWYPVDSPAYKGIRDGLTWILDEFEFFEALDDSGFTDQISQLETARNTFDADDVLKGIAKGIDGAPGTKSDADNLALLEDSDSWGGVDTVGRHVDRFAGRAMEAFQQRYVDQFPYILTGQMATIEIVRQGVEVAGTAYKQSREDAENVAKATINALEPGGGGYDIDWEMTLQVLAAVAAIAGGVAASTTAAGAFGVISGLSSLGAIAAGAGPGEEASAKEKPIEIGGGTVAETLSSAKAALDTAKQDLEDIEDRTARWLSAFQDGMHDSSGIPVTEPVAEELTVREAFFEVARPALADVGETRADGDSETNMSYEELTASEYVGAPRSAEDAVAADLKDLHSAGSILLPDLAGQYSEKATQVRDAVSPNGYSYSSGPLYPELSAVYELLMEFLTNSAENLGLVGQALVLTAEAFAEADESIAKELNDLGVDLD